MFWQQGNQRQRGIACAAILLVAAQVTNTADASDATYTAVNLYTLTAPTPTLGASGYPQSCVAAQVVGRVEASGGPGRAAMWTNAGALVDLYPASLGNFTDSYANATDGLHQVGSVQINYSHFHAVLWNGTAASAVDLNPTNLVGFTDSVAIGTSGMQQVGYASGLTATLLNNPNAMLWSGTASSAVDLNPTGFRASAAWGTNGRQEVGGGVRVSGDVFEALLWSGTAGSAINLNPTRLPAGGGSFANGVSPNGGQQVGSAAVNIPGSQNQNNHAMLWTGSAESAIDLNPAQLGLDNSLAYATNGTQQVGYGYTLADIDHHHALVWSGTAASAVDLQALLPFTLVSSTAYSIDSAGNIFGVASDSSGRSHAVEWMVPEPSAFVLAPLLLAMMALPRSRRA